MMNTRSAMTNGTNNNSALTNKNNVGTPNSASGTASVTTVVNKTSNKLLSKNNAIVGALSPAATDLVEVINRKMNELNDQFKEELKKHCDKLDELRDLFKNEIKEHEDRVMQKLSSVSADITNLRSDVVALNSRCDSLAVRCDALNVIVEKQQRTIDMFENNLVSSDIVINNIPNAVDASASVNKILSTLQCSSLSLRKVFRIRSKLSDKYEPIIAKFSSSDERVSFFRALAEFRKNTKRQLQYRDAGIEGDGNIFVHECLTTSNRQLLNSALLHKRNKLLNTVYTLRGEVYVRVQADGRAIKIKDVKKLSDIAGGIN